MSPAPTNPIVRIGSATIDRFPGALAWGTRLGHSTAPNTQTGSLVARRVPLAARLVQEPNSPFRLVDPVLDEARSRNVAHLVNDVVRFPQTRRQGHVVLAQFRQHVERIDILGVVILDVLNSSDV